MTRIGVLALQGAVREHIESLKSPGVEVIEVKKVEELAELDGLVLPGGESTTMRRLIDRYGFYEPLKQFAADGKPMFGTCAGMILMADKIAGSDEGHLSVMDVTVQRNAFGRQRESFETNLMMTDVGDDIRAVFIRAPLIVEVGEGVEVLSKYGDDIVAVKEGRNLACSFHPELTDDTRVHQLFISMVEEAKKERA